LQELRDVWHGLLLLLLLLLPNPAAILFLSS
jgi:hypothetical protein